MRFPIRLMSEFWGTRMSVCLEPSTKDDLPPPSVELDALMLLVEAYIDAEGHKAGQRLLLAAARRLARREETDAIVVELYPPKEAAARAKVRRQTTAWFRRNLPRWLERLSNDGE